ncbi:MAG: hypothetical protein HY232_13080 [Acidobacteria bacterium]|nr:hypothetical protein [Acidobacteriota bacterium]
MSQQTKDAEHNENPPHMRLKDNHPSKGELYEHHLKNGTLEAFYEMFELDRPPTRDRGRGR